MASVEDVTALAMQLSQNDRAALAQQLLRSLEEDEVDFAVSYEKEWAEEIERRGAAMDRG